MPRFFAKKSVCAMGHTHDSAREAAYCGEVMARFRAGEIEAVVFQPVLHFEIGGAPVKMLNGHKMTYTGDFGWVENGRTVICDVKARNGFMTRDVPVKLAILRHIMPEVEFRIVK